MASIFKRTIKRWVDGDGKRVKAGTPGARQVTALSEVYYGEYTDETGKRRSVALYSDKGMSRQKVAQLEKEAARRDCGLSDKYGDHAKAPLATHLADYAEHLTDKGNTPLHVQGERNRIQRAIDACGFQRLPDVKPEKIRAYLSSLRRNKTKPMGAVTHNHLVRAVKAYTRWAVSEGRLPYCPLQSLTRINPRPDRRHKRRSLTPAEFQKFLSTTKESPRIDKGGKWRFDGQDRHILYLTAGMTGLRASELASLRVSSFDFGHGVLTVDAAYSKHRKTDHLPIHAELATVLKSYFEARKLKADDFLFPGPWASQKRGCKLIKRDLDAAGIPYETSQGVFDFHSLRGQFVTNLARHGVSITQAKELARHSTITLTADLYTKHQMTELAEAMKKLPSPI